MCDSPFRGLRVLIVEDEYPIAMSLQEYFTLLGAVIVGPVASVAQALKAIEANRDLNVALLDVKLRGALAYPVAESLLSYGIPFVFTSAYDSRVLAHRYPQIANIQKPYLMRDLEKGLASAIAQGSQPAMAALPPPSRPVAISHR